MDRVLGIIVTYNPNCKELALNLRSIINQVDLLVLVDNDSVNEKEIKSLCNEFCITSVMQDSNIGLGAAYNLVLDKHRERFKFFVTFDQDTFIPAETISILTNFLKNDSNIGAIGPSFSRNLASVRTDSISIEFRDVIIQSCTVFRSELFDIVGRFNEIYFVDLTDFEYCLRIRYANFKIAICKGVNIYHELGEIVKIKNREIVVHGLLRNYYLARNHMRLCKSFIFVFPIFVLKLNFFYMIRIYEIAFIEKDLDKIKVIYKGLLGLDYKL